MDQGITVTFKGIVESVQASDSVTARDYLRSYNILKAISKIAAAWKEVSQSYMNGNRRKLWPVSAVVEDVIRMAEDGEPLSNEDFEELAAQLAK